MGSDGQSDPAQLVHTLLHGEDGAGGEEPVAAGGMVGGHDDQPLPSLREVLARGGTATAITLFGVNAVDEFDRAAIAVLGPDIQRTFGLSDTMLGVVVSVGSIATLLCAIPLAVLGDRVRRTAVIGITSFVWAAFALLSGFANSAWQLAACRFGNGAGKGTEGVQRSLLADAYPAGSRGRIFGLHQFANPAGAIVGPLVAGGVAALAGGADGWRWALALLSIPAVVLGIATLRLREPVRGVNDSAAVLDRGSTAGTTAGDNLDEPPISFAAAWERLHHIPTYSHVLAALGAIGLALFGLPAVQNLFVEERYGLGSFGRGVVAAGITVGGAVGVVAGGVRADQIFRADPPRILRVVAGAVAVCGLTLPLSLLMPNAALYTIVNGVGSFSVSFALAPAATVIAAIVPFPIRSLGFAMVPIYAVLVGGLGGAILTGLLSDAFGRRAALVWVTIPAMALGAALLHHGARFVGQDIALVADELREEHDERARMRTTERADVPAIRVRHLDVYHGSLQVLFDVSVDVHQGEALAVLGTNGAGKSTLLRAIAGLHQPRRGVIRFDGRNVTYTAAEARVRRGVVLVAGGRSVFPALTVEENLICGAYTMLSDARAARERIESVVDQLPELGPRLRQRAGSLSGGQQQMLAIAKALVVEPDVLLLDELTSGLAPGTVTDVVDIVARLRAGGVTIVVVDQSLEVARLVADRAVFMERGRVRFDGPVGDLAQRDDLVRPVFFRSTAT